LDKCPAFILGPGIVGTNQIYEVAFDLVSNKLEDVGQVLAFRGQLYKILVWPRLC